MARTRAVRRSSNSGFSLFTTKANNWSSNPSSVTMKFTNDVWAAISGR
jgi:hypothetical protein